MTISLDDILAAFEGELKLSGVRPTDSFFELGGDSLMAETLVLRLSRVSGVELQTSVLLQAPTPEALAALIARQGSGFDRLVMPIPGCTGTAPAAMIHGMSGSALFVSRFGEGFKSRCRLVAIRGMGLQPGEDPFVTAGDIADGYMAGLEAVLGRQPGIYGGICLGGLVAIDLARRHFRATRRKPLLILIDPPPLGSAWLKPMQDNRMSVRRERQLNRLATRWRRLRDGFDRIGLGETVLGRKARRETFKRSLTRALAGYAPEAFPFDMLMIASSEWGRTTIEQYRAWTPPESTLHCVTIEGNHGRFQTANTAAIDGAISDFLDSHRVERAVA